MVSNGLSSAGWGFVVNRQKKKIEVIEFRFQATVDTVFLEQIVYEIEEEQCFVDMDVRQMRQWNIFCVKASVTPG